MQNIPYVGYETINLLSDSLSMFSEVASRYRCYHRSHTTDRGGGRYIALRPHNTGLRRTKQYNSSFEVDPSWFRQSRGPLLHATSPYTLHIYPSLPTLKSRPVHIISPSVSHKVPHPPKLPSLSPVSTQAPKSASSSASLSLASLSLSAVDLAF